MDKSSKKIEELKIRKMSREEPDIRLEGVYGVTSFEFG